MFPLFTVPVGVSASSHQGLSPDLSSGTPGLSRSRLFRHTYASDDPGTSGRVSSPLRFGPSCTPADVVGPCQVEFPVFFSRPVHRLEGPNPNLFSLDLRHLSRPEVGTHYSLGASKVSSTHPSPRYVVKRFSGDVPVGPSVRLRPPRFPKPSRPPGTPGYRRHVVREDSETRIPDQDYFLLVPGPDVPPSLLVPFRSAPDDGRLRWWRGPSSPRHPTR